MAQLSISIAPVTAAEAFFGSSEAFMEGVRVLIKATPIPAVALTFLCGHSLESMLKSFLAKSGVAEKSLSKSPFGHDLVMLWKDAAVRGLSLPHPPPDWLDQLARVYGPPHVVRYPMGLNGLVLPNLSALAVGLEDILQNVRVSCAGFGGQ